MERSSLDVAIAAIAIGSLGCSAPASSSGGSASSGAERPAASADLVGVTTRAEIEARVPAWRDAAAAADIEEETARELASVPPGAEIDVFLGTWCGDSRREISRLFRALEQVPEPWPFTIRWIAVDRAKSAPGYTEGADLRFVPTLIVRRGGAEIGRLVETTPRAIERELVDLLRGASSGVISARDDL
jgi:hypothetical protein